MAEVMRYYTYSIVDGERDSDDQAAVWVADDPKDEFVQCGQAGRSIFEGLGPSWWDDIVTFCEFVSECTGPNKPEPDHVFAIWDDQERYWQVYRLSLDGTVWHESFPQMMLTHDYKPDRKMS